MHGPHAQAKILCTARPIFPFPRPHIPGPPLRASIAAVIGRLGTGPLSGTVSRPPRRARRAKQHLQGSSQEIGRPDKKLAYPEQKNIVIAVGTKRTTNDQKTTGKTTTSVTLYSPAPAVAAVQSTCASWATPTPGSPRLPCFSLLYLPISGSVSTPAWKLRSSLAPPSNPPANGIKTEV